MSGVYLLLSIQQGIHKGKAQCLGLGTIYQTAHKPDMLSGQFRVDLFPDRQSPFAHSHEAALLRPGDQLPQLLLQGSKFLLRHGRRQRNQLCPAGAYPEKAIAKAVEGLHISQTDGKLLHGDMRQNIDMSASHHDGIILCQGSIIAGIPETADAHGKRIAFAPCAGQSAGKLLIHDEQTLVPFLAQNFFRVGGLPALPFGIRFLPDMEGQSLAGGKRAAAFPGRQRQFPCL